MEQAIERVSKTIDEYSARKLSRSLATIELVSAFKVIGKKSSLDTETPEAAVPEFVERQLKRLDSGESDNTQTIAELARVYGAAFRSDPGLAEKLAGLG